MLKKPLGGHSNLPSVQEGLLGKGTLFRYILTCCLLDRIANDIKKISLHDITYLISRISHLLQ